MQGESSVDARPLEDGLHDEVVGSVDPEGVIAEPLAKDAVPLWTSALEYLGQPEPLLLTVSSSRQVLYADCHLIFNVSK